MALWLYHMTGNKALIARALAALLAWLGFTAGMASSGFLSQWDSLPPRAPFVPLGALIILVSVSRTQFFTRLLLKTPRHWPVALQSFRILVELAFYALFTAGLAPVQVTFEGRNFDIFVGLTAPLVAIAIARLNLSRRAVIAWNILGLLVLLNTIGTVLTSVPGPLHQNWPGQPFTAFTTWPVIWIPAFLAPLAIFLHINSIRQNLKGE